MSVSFMYFNLWLLLNLQALEGGRKFMLSMRTGLPKQIACQCVLINIFMIDLQQSKLFSFLVYYIPDFYQIASNTHVCVCVYFYILFLKPSRVLFYEYNYQHTDETVCY